MNEAVSDMVNHPRHYNVHPSGIECVDIVRDMTFDSGNALKYVWRAEEKFDAVEDRKKARFYLTDAVEHNDVIILARKVTAWSDRMEAVIDAEPDPGKKRFYAAILVRELPTALAVLNDMIGETSDGDVHD